MGDESVENAREDVRWLALLLSFATRLRFRIRLAGGSSGGRVFLACLSSQASEKSGKVIGLECSLDV